MGNRQRRWLAFLLTAVAVGMAIVGWLGLSQRPSSSFDLSQHNVPIDHIVSGGPGKDGIPALSQPRFVRASQATFLRADDRVLGLTVGAEAKAYPIKILNWHEIVNDRIGGDPVLITYCPLCGSGIGFSAMVNGRALSFGVSGLLYQSDLLMYDRQTESLWSQMAMQAVAGPMTGTSLAPVFLEHTTWEDWRTTHPDTLVLSIHTGHRRDYDQDPYLGYAERRDLMFDTSHFDPSYHPKDWVLGLDLDGVTKAFPFTELERVETPLSDTVGGRRLTIEFNRQTRSARVLDERGSPLPTVMAYWFAWYAFHPDTQVLRHHSRRSDNREGLPLREMDSTCRRETTSTIG